MRFPILSKAGALIAVTAGLMWSLGSVQSIVQERQQRQNGAERSVANSLAGSQMLLGPVITRTCTETWVYGQTVGADTRPVSDSRVYKLRLPASQLKVNGQIEMTPRHRGMFKVNSYGVKSLITAQWPSAQTLTVAPQHAGGHVSCEAPRLHMALSDARGIRVAELQVNARPVAVLPGSGLDGTPRGFQATLDGADWPANGPVSVVVSLELAGTQRLSVVPVADTTLVKLDGDWPHPSFGGRFLPTERHIGDRQFDATWKVTSLASTAQQEWIKGSALCGQMSVSEPNGYGAANAGAASADNAQASCVEAFGVDFMDPINPYVLSDRATKYGLLFIVLTFVGVGLIEVLRRLRVHPIQYLLVGAALSVFFLLLVSLSEQMAFGYAYATASLACTVLLAFYGSFVLGGWLAGAAFGAGIAGLFGTLYALLQMEQRALMMGSVLLFAVLTVVMITTRKLDWYALLAQVRRDVPPAGQDDDTALAR